MTVWIEIGGKKLRVDLPVGAGDGGVLKSALDCRVDGRAMTVNACLLQPGVMSLVLQGRQYRCVLDGDGVVIGGRRYGFVVDDPRSLQGRRGAGAGSEGPRPVKAPMPGRVVRLLMSAGDDVAEGQAIMVIEAMKMQNELKSPKGGRVIRVTVAVGDTVGAGDVLAVVE